MGTPHMGEAQRPKGKIRYSCYLQPRNRKDEALGFVAE